VEIWHLKAAGRPTGAVCRRFVAHIEQAPGGRDVAADPYGIPPGFTLFSAVIPPWGARRRRPETGRAP